MEGRDVKRKKLDLARVGGPKRRRPRTVKAIEVERGQEIITTLPIDAPEGTDRRLIVRGTVESKSLHSRFTGGRVELLLQQRDGHRRTVILEPDAKVTIA